MKISVVMPVYNEVQTIKEIVARVQEVELEKEIIIVDDYSTDGTREHLREINQANENVKVLYHDHNQGKGAALRTGFQAITGDIVIIQDADLEYDPREYPLFWGPSSTAEPMWYTARGFLVVLTGSFSFGTIWATSS